jgi:hypothetical protein
MSAPALRAVTAGAVLALSACSNPDMPGNDFERMLVQDHYLPYEKSEFFADERELRTPPEGAIPRDEIVGDPALTTGVVSGVYVDRTPLPLGRATLDRGHDRFDRFCAPCHGVAGDGVSRVARSMTLRKPPSLVDARARAFPPGRVFQVTTLGYGLMRSYAEDLEVADRWAVVAYLRALQRSAEVPLDSLPPRARGEAEKELQ